MLVDVVRAGAVQDIQRIRRLPLAGEVLVFEGEQVQPNDVIAEASIPDKLFMLDIARGLGVDKSDVKRCLVRQPGEHLIEGDVIAQVDGAIPRLVRSPLSGQFTGIHQGYVLLEVGRDTLQVRAGMIGVVNAVIPEYGAILSTSGLLVQGGWGNGRIGFGKLRVLPETWSVPMDSSMLAAVDTEQVIAAGYCSSEEALAFLQASKPAGLILGTLAPRLASMAAMLPMPIILLQGWGICQPDPFFLELLEPHAGETACLQAGETDRIEGVRPEVIIPHDGDFEPDTLGIRAELSTGQRVGVFSGEGMEVVGEVVSLPEAPTLFESGLQLPAAVVQLKNGEQVTAPQQNLVVLS